MKRFTEQQKSAALFVYERCLDRDGASSAYRKSIVHSLDALYPDTSSNVNRRLSLLLKRLDAGRLVERTIPLLEQSETQQQRMHHLFVLRDVKTGWTADARRTYFEHLRRFGEFTGGDGMPTFRKLIETDALASLPDSQRKPLEKLLRDAVDPWMAEIPQQKRSLVRKWAPDDFVDSLDELTGGRDFDRGKRMFAVRRGFWQRQHGSVV